MLVFMINPKTSIMTTACRVLSFFIFAFVLFSCKEEKKDPNKQVDEGTVTGEIYESKELGWKMEIPNGWPITSRDQVQANSDKGKKMMEKTMNAEIDMSGVKQLISFGKDPLNNFGSNSEPFKEEYAGHHKENTRQITDIIFRTFLDQGINCDTARGTETIGGLTFETFYTTIYAPRTDSVILRQILYMRLINGYNFSANINYNNEADRDAMLKAWKASKFQ